MLNHHTRVDGGVKKSMYSYVCLPKTRKTDNRGWLESDIPHYSELCFTAPVMMFISQWQVGHTLVHLCSRIQHTEQTKS